MSKRINALPGLGLVHPDGAGYRVTNPVTPDMVSALIREKWCHRVQVSDGRGGTAEFQAYCVIDGNPLVVTGQIGGR